MVVWSSDNNRECVGFQDSKGRVVPVILSYAITKTDPTGASLLARASVISGYAECRMTMCLPALVKEWMIKKGGPNPSSNTSNTVLAAVLEKARELEVPKEIVERNIKRASEKGQEAFIEKFYEVYGFGGVGMVVEVLTDKITRSVADVRGVVKDSGAKLADPGSILFKFRRVRVVNVKVNDNEKDQVLAIALDAGAEDVIEPNFDEEDDSEYNSDSYYKIVVSAENYSDILSKLRDAAIAYEPDNGYELLPLNPIEVSSVNCPIILRFLES
ncbi:probable transcriptional regulatory protein At2g25830 [Phalaenopsis equestris]|uniref:probable transcriptional regulatory protein At2g25830 n=1 Tax=Phalaenopsis equestris TaxID=78828 RepID=UPI0009E5A237|nr:probable transcriptional regulatory protein At2g25830 [Phalaenopsis equestris]